MQSYYEIVTRMDGQVGAHSLRFTPIDDTETLSVQRNTWYDWGLIPASVPTVARPDVFSNTIDIPGTNGVIDLSQALLGFPTFKKRTGSWDFYCDLTKVIENSQITSMNGKRWEREALYSSLSAFLHGQRRKVILLDDDPAYEYQGTFKVGSITTGKGFPKVTINYDLEPFKYLRWSTHGEWMWDPFDFLYGEITSANFNDLPVTFRTFEYTLLDTPSAPTFEPYKYFYLEENRYKAFSLPPGNWDTNWTDYYKRDEVTNPNPAFIWHQDKIGQAPVFPKIYVSGAPITMFIQNPTTNAAQAFDIPVTGVDGTPYSNPQLMLVAPYEGEACIIECRIQDDYVMGAEASVSFDFTLGRL